MKTSIVIPSYNAGRYLPATIQSVLNQTVPDWEMVIVDDGSQDRSYEIAAGFAERDSRVRVVRQANAGVAEARNRGLRECKPTCDCVCFLDADDILEPETVETLAATLQDCPHAVAAHGTARYIDQNGRETRFPEIEEQVRGRYTVVDNSIVACPKAGATTFATLIVANCIVTPGAVLIRRPALAAVGEFDKATSPCEDWDMWLRLSRLGDFAFIDRPVVEYRRHGANTSNNLETMWRASDAVRSKATFSPQNDDRQAAIARFVYDHPANTEYSARIHWARECFSHGQILSAAKHLRHAYRNRAGASRQSAK